MPIGALDFRAVFAGVIHWNGFLKEAILGDMERGFIQLIVILVLVLVILSLLGISLSALFQNRTLKDNFSFAFGGVEYVWTNYLARPAKILGGTFLDLIWQPFADVFEGFKGGVNPFKSSTTTPATSQ